MVYTNKITESVAKVVGVVEEKFEHDHFGQGDLGLSSIRGHPKISDNFIYGIYSY